MKFLRPSFNNLSSKALTSFILNIYFVAIFVIYPFFMKTGYVNISDHKFYFFLYSSLGAVFLVILTGLIELIKSFHSFNSTDLFLLLFIIVSIISFGISPYKEVSFLGTGGWYMGFLTMIIMSVLYILISRLWEYEKNILFFPLIATFVVYLLGILDRFSIYLIPLDPRNPSFISTLGNINWFVGYYSVITPIGCGLFMYHFEKNKNSLLTKALGIWVVISFMAGFSQGSESVFLFDIALFGGLLFLCSRGMLRLENWFFTAFLWGLSSFFISIMRYCMPQGYNYDGGGIFDFFTKQPTGMYIAVIAFFGYFLLTKCDDEMRYKKISWVVYLLSLGTVFIGVIIFIILGILNTNGKLSNPIYNSMFFFNESFGSGRGEAYKIAALAFKNMPFVNKLFGMGPDTFSSFVYSIEPLREELYRVWPEDILTNAHCEYLTLLINEGIVGLLVYIGIFVSFISRNIRKCKNPVVMCITLSVFCYMVHNLLSFMQVLNTPYLFILMGIAKACDESVNKV